MRKTIIPIAMLILSGGSFFPALAQSDSSRLDLGYFTLSKSFTQQLSIKGSDLEMMPFTNLSDAIRAWLYGGYSTPATLQYVVDGNPVADVNAYSVHDIDEVTLIQSAAATMTTAPGQQQLVLVKTKREQVPGGVCVAAQTGLVTTDKKQYSSTTAFFHNHYGGFHQNTGKISYGASGNFVRDVLPYTSIGEKIVTPYSLSRWRLNGYFDWRPNDHHRIELTMNYTTQQWKGQQDTVAGSGSSTYLQQGHQHFLVPHLDWLASWGSGWTNNLQGTYLHSTSVDAEASVFYGNPGQEEAGYFGDNMKSYQLWLHDRIGYTEKLGSWVMSSAVNLSWQQFRNEKAVAVQNAGTNYYGTAMVKTTVWLVTPTFGLRYRKTLNIEAGAIIHPWGATSLTYNGQQAYPFANAAVDLLQLSGKPGENSLKVFGSVASRTGPAINDYLIVDYSSGIDLFFNLPSASPALGSAGPPAGFTVIRPPVFWTWESGATYEAWKGRLQVGFNFENRIFSPIGSDFGGVFGEGFWKYHSSLEHLDLRLKVLDGATVSWRTGLNVTAMRWRAENFQSNGTTFAPPMGDFDPNPTSWTGGWVNRVAVGKLSFGLDLLYHFNHPNLYGTKTSVTTPNIYAAYRFHLPATGTVQVFAGTRGQFVNWYSDLANASQYYTVGANICL